MLFMSVFSSLETDRSHIKAKLLVAFPKVGHFDVQQGELFHLGGADLQDGPVEALPVLQTDRRTHRWSETTEAGTELPLGRR